MTVLPDFKKVNVQDMCECANVCACARRAGWALALAGFAGILNNLHLTCAT